LGDGEMLESEVTEQGHFPISQVVKARL